MVPSGRIWSALACVEQSKRYEPRLVQIHTSILIGSDAFESGKRKNWDRILRYWVLRSFRRVLAERVADADEDVGVPSENFSPCPRASVRGLPRRRAISKVISPTRRASRFLKRFRASSKCQTAAGCFSWSSSEPDRNRPLQSHPSQLGPASVSFWIYGLMAISPYVVLRYLLQSERPDCMHGGHRDESLEVTLMPGVRAEAIATNFC